MQRKALGKGLKALIPETQESSSQGGGTPTLLRIDQISPNRNQPRKSFNHEKIRELSQSIKEKGIIQPIIVQKKNGEYELIAGERRWRAAQLAGLSAIPVIIKDVTDLESMEIALIENIQREDLNPIEEGLAYKRLIEEFKFTQDELSKRVGKDRSTIANTMRLTNLPLTIQDDVADKLLTMGHARAILAIRSIDQQIRLRDRIIKDGLSVRAVESIIQGKNKKKIVKKGASENSNAHILKFENRLQKKIGTKVKINKNGKNGKVEIYFYSEDDLEHIVETILENKHVC